jgi:hypothetical protein
VVGNLFWAAAHIESRSWSKSCTMCGLWHSQKFLAAHGLGITDLGQCWPTFLPRHTRTTRCARFWSRLTLMVCRDTRVWYYCHYSTIKFNFMLYAVHHRSMTATTIVAIQQTSKYYFCSWVIFNGFYSHSIGMSQGNVANGKEYQYVEGTTLNIWHSQYKQITQQSLLLLLVAKQQSMTFKNENHTILLFK